MATQSNFLQNIPPVTRSLLIVNVLMFVATLINPTLMKGLFAMAYPASSAFRWWQPLTHMFMHDSIWHILFNMYTLVMFGMVVERSLGSRRFLILFFVTGFGAVLLHTGVEYLQVRSLVREYTPVPYSAQQIYDMIPHVLGASGAVSAVCSVSTVFASAADVFSAAVSSAASASADVAIGSSSNLAF